MLETNMPTKLSIYTKYLMGLYGQCIQICVPHLKSLQSTMQQALYTYQTYITEQIWLLHDTFIFHCTATLVYIYTPH